jgi:hypothetical protein
MHIPDHNAVSLPAEHTIGIYHSSSTLNIMMCCTIAIYKPGTKEWHERGRNKVVLLMPPRLYLIMMMLIAMGRSTS